MWERFVGTKGNKVGGASDCSKGVHFLELLEHSHAGHVTDSRGQDGLLRSSVLPLLTRADSTSPLNAAKEHCNVYRDGVDPIVRAVHEVHLWLSKHAGFAPLFLPSLDEVHGKDAAAAALLRAQLAKLSALLHNLDQKLILDVLLVDVKDMSLSQQGCIFAQLNSRGRDMSVADKFKSRLYYATAEAAGRRPNGGRANQSVPRKADQLFAWTSKIDSEATTQVRKPRAQPLPTAMSNHAH